MIQHQDFLLNLNLRELSNDEGYREGQYGKAIDSYEQAFPDVEAADIVIVGVTENRGRVIGGR